jgi:hypothetical protein
MQKIAAIYSPLLFFLGTATAAAEATATADIAGATAIAAGASAGAEASTTSDIFYPNTALIFPLASSKILTPDAECAA